MTGTARPVHMGRSTSTIEIVLVDDRGRRTCTARLTCLHRDVPPPDADAAAPSAADALAEVGLLHARIGQQLVAGARQRRAPRSMT